MTDKTWIQEAVKHMDKGAFTKQSKRSHKTPLKFAKSVLSHPKKHTLKTRRRAQFLMNISKRKTRGRK
jgi:hypothetical protein